MIINPSVQDQLVLHEYQYSLIQLQFYSMIIIFWALWLILYSSHFQVLAGEFQMWGLTMSDNKMCTGSHSRTKDVWELFLCLEFL